MIGPDPQLWVAGHVAAQLLQRRAAQHNAGPARGIHLPLVRRVDLRVKTASTQVLARQAGRAGRLVQEQAWKAGRDTGRQRDKYETAVFQGERGRKCQSHPNPGYYQASAQLERRVRVKRAQVGS